MKNRPTASRGGEPNESGHHGEPETNVGRADPKAAAQPEQGVELHDDGRASADGGGDRGSAQAELGERTEPEDQAGVEHDVQTVGEP
jgi:hypothetical protein